MTTAHDVNEGQSIPTPWFYVSGGETVGPVTTDLLLAYLNGQDDWRGVFIWNVDLVDWKVAGDVSEITQLISRPPPPPQQVRGPESTAKRSAVGATYDTIRKNQSLRVNLFLAVLMSAIAVFVWSIASLSARVQMTYYLGIFVGVPLFCAFIGGGIAGWIAFSWRRAWTGGRRTFTVAFALCALGEIWRFLEPQSKDDQKLLIVVLAGGTLFLAARAMWDWPSDVRQPPPLPPE